LELQLDGFTKQRRFLVAIRRREGQLTQEKLMASSRQVEVTR
jgi:hypothetical protein